MRIRVKNRNTMFSYSKSTLVFRRNLLQEHPPPMEDKVVRHRIKVKKLWIKSKISWQDKIFEATKEKKLK